MTSWRLFAPRLAAAAVALCMMAGAPDAVAVTPSVINGTPHPAWARSVVAITTPSGSCSGALLTANIIVTAGHCVVAHDGIPAPATGDLRIYPPGADTSQVQPAHVRVVQTYFDPNYHPETGPDAWDLAYLVTDGPVGAPLIARNATSAEANAIAAGAYLLASAGYGQTVGGKGNPPSVIPYGLTQVVTNPRYTGGAGVITLTGDPSSGTCYGDSGGPWLAQIGADLLLVGVTSNGTGPACDLVTGSNITRVAVTAGRPDMEAAARASAAPYVQAPGTTCLLGSSRKPSCQPGNAWRDIHCYPGAVLGLQYFDGTTWKAFGTGTGRRSARCPRAARYLITAQGTQPLGSSIIRLVQPVQPGVPVVTTEQYTVFAT